MNHWIFPRIKILLIGILFNAAIGVIDVRFMFTGMWQKNRKNSRMWEKDMYLIMYNYQLIIIYRCKGMPLETSICMSAVLNVWLYRMALFRKRPIYTVGQKAM